MNKDKGRSLVVFWEHAAAKRHSRYGQFDMEAFTAFLKDPQRLVDNLILIRKLQCQGLPGNVVDLVPVMNAGFEISEEYFATACPHCGVNMMPPWTPKPGG